ncbi:MAG: hypothetical protein ACXAC7_21525 [Candidatus Hodarchaeales archaeon]
MANKDLIQALDIAIEALEICNAIHDRTGALKVPLKDVAEEMGRGIKVKDIQDGFWLLVDLHIIGDDGDEMNMNYSDDGGDLVKLLKAIKVEELEKESEIKETIYF